MNENFKFLIACCKTYLTNKDIEQIQNIINTHNDPSVLVAVAIQQGVLPLVYKTLKKLSQNNNDLDQNFQSHSTLTELLDNLKTEYSNIARRNILMSAELIYIMKILKKNNIEALPFKGPVLSQTIYGDITMRQYIDLDILIKKKDLERFIHILSNEGYTAMLERTPAQSKVWYRYAKDMSFIEPSRHIIIDAHWIFLDRDYPVNLPVDTFWENTTTVSLNKYDLKTFSNEDLLIYLCVHGSKHLWDRLIWAKDIDMLVSQQELDWNYLFDKIDSASYSMMFLLGLYLSASIFGTPLPKAIEIEISKNDKNLSAIQKFIFENWADKKSTLPDTSAMLRLFPSTPMKIKYLYKVIIKPSENEYKQIDLPYALYWIYYLIRPYLLIKKYLGLSH